MYTSEVVVAMNPLQSQRKERKVFRGSKGTMPVINIGIGIGIGWRYAKICLVCICN